MSHLKVAENAIAPSTPAAGTVILYPKADGLWYSKDDAGTETVLSAGPGGSTTQVQFNDGGVLGGDAGLTYVKGTDTLTAGNITVTTNQTVGGTLGVTGVATFTAAPVFSSTTASRFLTVDGSKALVGAAVASSVLLNSLSDPTGTGVAVFSISPTFTGTVTAAAITATGNIDFAGFDLTASDGSTVFTSSKQTASMQVNGTVTTDSADTQVFRVSTGTATTGTSARFVQFLSAGGSGDVGKIRLNNNAVAYDTTSDARLKTVIRAAGDGLERILNIEVVDFYWNNDPTKRPVRGVFAQQLHQSCPDAVGVGGDNPATNPWSVDYGRITPDLINAVQVLSKRLGWVEQHVDTLSRV